MMREVRVKERGFTLLEMMLALILISSAAFVLLVKLPVNVEQQRLDLAATQLLTEIRDVRQAALAENNWYRIKFYAQNGDHNYQVFRQGVRVKEIHLQDGIQFVAKPEELTFNAVGRSAGTTIILQNATGKRKSVIVAPVGMRIRAE